MWSLGQARTYCRQAQYQLLSMLGPDCVFSSGDITVQYRRCGDEPRVLCIEICTAVYTAHALSSQGNYLLLHRTQVSTPVFVRISCSSSYHESLLVPPFLCSCSQCICTKSVAVITPASCNISKPLCSLLAGLGGLFHFSSCFTGCRT